MWLQSVAKDDLDRLVREGECCQLASGIDGEIYWASDALCEWSGYTLQELMALGWFKLSVDDDNLAADKKAADEMRLGLRATYQVEKKYRKKNGTEHWGLLHAKRVPSSGDFQYAWCHWTPFVNGTQTAFSKVMEFQSALEKKLMEMTTEIKSLTNQTDEDKWVIGTVRMCQRHPRIAAFIVFVVLSIFGLNNVLELAQRVGAIPVPVSVKVEK
jgi:PAS domain S-box-containing protein